MVVIFCVVVLIELPRRYRRWYVEADREGMRLKTVGLLGAKERSVPNDDIAELRVEGGHLIMITTRSREAVCGRLDNPLPKAELEWLRDELTRALKG